MTTSVATSPEIIKPRLEVLPGGAEDSVEPLPVDSLATQSFDAIAKSTQHLIAEEFWADGSVLEHEPGYSRATFRVQTAGELVLRPLRLLDKDGWEEDRKALAELYGGTKASYPNGCPARNHRFMEPLDDETKSQRFFNLPSDEIAMDIGFRASGLKTPDQALDLVAEDPDTRQFLAHVGLGFLGSNTLQGAEAHMIVSKWARRSGLAKTMYLGVLGMMSYAAGPQETSVESLVNYDNRCTLATLSRVHNTFNSISSFPHALTNNEEQMIDGGTREVKVTLTPVLDRNLIEARQAA
ncbi:hypothetical protein CR970_00345 [Candidatus Saccharibacteria bacterium]|nr:MAG: hypothetical protein CR970_00345 [Candidatus Saccharibacteria bacterium]